MQSYSVNLVSLHFFSPRLSSSHLLQHPAPPVEPCPTVWKPLSYRESRCFRWPPSDDLQMSTKSQHMLWVSVINSREMTEHWLQCVCTLSFSQQTKTKQELKSRNNTNWQQRRQLHFAIYCINFHLHSFTHSFSQLFARNFIISPYNLFCQNKRQTLFK